MQRISVGAANTPSLPPHTCKFTEQQLIAPHNSSSTIEVKLVKIAKVPVVKAVKAVKEL
jgi:hypothetical protein